MQSKFTLASWLISTPCSCGSSVSDHTSPGRLSNESISSVAGVGGYSSPTQGDSMCARGNGDCSITGLGQWLACDDSYVTEE